MKSLDVPLPPPALRFRVAGTAHEEWFEKCGDMTMKSFERALDSLGKNLQSFQCILDFGAGCGRLTRHLVKTAKEATIAACDIDASAMAWMREHLPAVDARTNRGLPPLSFDAESFDLVLGFSVFTHLNEAYQDAWLAELRRVTRPGAILLITVMGQWNWDDSLGKLAGLEALANEFSSRGFCYTTMDGWSEHFPDYYHTAFHQPNYVRERWSRWFDVLDVRYQAAEPHQDMVILQRRVPPFARQPIKATKDYGPESAQVSAVSQRSLQAEIESVKYWYHQIELAPGIITPGCFDGNELLMRLRLPADCSGMRVLDLGTRDGFFAFAMEKRGAEVIATDYWPKTETGFDVAARALGSHVRFIQQNIYDLSVDQLGQFDIVLCLGLIYHLPDPLRALHLIRRVCRGRLYVESHIIDQQFRLADGRTVLLESVAPELVKTPIMQFYPGSTLDHDPTNYWGPNLACLEQMAGECNFTVLESQTYGGRGIVTCEIANDANAANLMEIAQGALLPS